MPEYSCSGRVWGPKTAIPTKNVGDSLKVDRDVVQVSIMDTISTWNDQSVCCVVGAHLKFGDIDVFLDWSAQG